jgi:predicted transcriptional regulator
VSAYVSNNLLSPAQLPEVIRAVYGSLDSLSAGRADGKQEALKPVVPIRRSVTPDYIICLDDGKKLKMLKRHLRTTYGMTPDDYRAKWGLPADYPMVAPNYAAQRSAFAKQIGLGRKPSAEGKRRGR